ncbi:hypothetical protein [Stenoxybacter acetivorans]|uniref:hypothetical protein n=1 Tax=Stenoxybacter acetivorans TaxID=422441 RepID=UPI0012ECB964|nr:hypothetical protein [Stenoxybacter acetivorans]
MLPEEIDLHDSVIKSMCVDYERCGVAIEVDSYLSDDSKHREPISIKFNNVSSMSKICDFIALQKNAKPGNVCYWNPSQFLGTTFIYLSDGCLAITAESIDVSVC